MIKFADKNPLVDSTCLKAHLSYLSYLCAMYIDVTIVKQYYSVQMFADLPQCEQVSRAEVL